MTETEVRVSEGWEVRGLDPVRGSFYLKLKIMNTCFKHGIFFTITWKTTYMDKAIIRNIVVCYKNFFAGIILLLKTSRNCLWWRVLRKKWLFEKLENSKKIFANLSLFSNVIGMQSTISGVGKNRLQEKCFLWVFWKS